MTKDNIMNPVTERIGELRLIPVVVIDNPEDAVPLGEALAAGGLPLAEITFRTDAAKEAIARLSGKLPEVLVGAGTVIKIEQVKRAVGAGAKFIISPGFNPKVVDYCIENKITVFPGISNPSLIEMALERGLTVVKFFPAEAAGGLRLLKAIAAPFDDIKFIPTGGINQNNLGEYLEFDRVHACAGSWIVKRSLVSAGRFDEITELTREALKLIP